MGLPSPAVELSECFRDRSAQPTFIQRSGTVTGSTVTVTSGGVTVDTGCVLTDSPISLGGAGSTVTISGAELRSDGSSVPLAVEAGGAATVAATTFRSTAGDITAVSVAEGASLTVGGSRLVKADGGADLVLSPEQVRCVHLYLLDLLDE